MPIILRRLASPLPVAFLVALLVAFLAPGPRRAAADEGAGEGEAIHLAASPSLSPDGRLLLFSWRGDLWRASSAGGRSVRLTRHPARDVSPEVSPDGRQVAFVSNRTGTDQIYVMPIEGGLPRRITTHTEGFRLEGWFPDGQALLVRIRLDGSWRGAERLCRRPLEVEAPLEILFDDYGDDADLSPDGRLLAFTREGTSTWRKGYRGSQASQVWLFDLEDRTFRRLTKDEGGERWPLFDTDGRHLYLVNQASGAWNLWRVDLESGEREAWTAFEDDGVVVPSMASDGSALVFRRLFDVWRLDRDAPLEPKKLTLYSGDDRTTEPTVRRTLRKADSVAFTDDGREIAFTAGGDVWVMDTELREPKRVTKGASWKGDPLFSPDHQWLYFVVDTEGRPDIWRARRKEAKRYWWQNERFVLEQVTDDDDEEGGLRFTPDGKRLAFVKGAGDLWTLTPDGKDPVRVFTSTERPSFDFSPDGQWVAYAVPDENANRDVWIRRADGSGEPFNVSRHPDLDTEPRFSPDGKLLVFSGRRWDEERDICYVWLRREDEERDKRDRTLEKALKAMKGRKKKGAKKKAAPRQKKPAEKPQPAPAARPADAIAGTWTGTVTGDEPIPPAGYGLTLSIERRPDGTLTGRLDVEDQFSTELDSITFDEKTGALAFSATTPLGTVTGEGDVREGKMEGTWVLEGVASGAFTSRRAEPEEPKAAPGKDGKTAEGKKAAPKKTEKKEAKKPEPVVIDFEGLEDRIHRISIPETTESGLLFSPDGKRLAFQATVKGAAGLYTVSIPDELTPKRLATVRGRGGRWLKEGNRIVWQVGGLPASLTAAGKSTSYAFTVRQRLDLGARNAAAFDRAWKILGNAYYDPALGGRDWKRIRAKYRPMAARCLTSDELGTVLRQMLGELNGSHLGYTALGSSWKAPGWREETGHLGARFDPTFAGPGLRVRDVVPETPADQARHRLHPGDVVLAIDRVEVDRSTNLARVLTGDPQRDVTLRVRAAKDGKERTMVLRPTSYRAVRAKLYDAWVKQEREAVERLGQGKLGYLHVRGMNRPSFQRFEADLYKAGHGKDGLVIDVRNNGGGFTADYLLTCLMQPEHAFTVSRGGRPGYPQDRMVYARWTKPIVVLVNQNSFSNAEIFAHAIQTLGRGRLAGVPTAGGVISTGGTRIMDVGWLRLPGRGWFLLPSGQDMEQNGCVPDVVVWPEPEEMPAGEDRQLEAGVELLLEDVAAWEKRPPRVPHYAAGRR